jgi:hypothetical protein
MLETETISKIGGVLFTLRALSACSSSEGPEDAGEPNHQGGSGGGSSATAGAKSATGGVGAFGGSSGNAVGALGSGGSGNQGATVPASSSGSSGSATTGGSGATGGASGGSIGGADISGGAGAAGADSRPPCMKNPKQVISIGDSYMNWITHTFPQDLDAAAGVTFRPTYAVGGFSMGSGGIGLIPPLFDTAVAADKDIIAVVLDGGGNDLLIPALGRPDCKNMADAATTAGCQAIVTDALAAAKALGIKMGDAGVHDVVYYFYPRVPAPTLLGGSNPNAMLDYSLPKAKAFCDEMLTDTQGKVHCWFVDTVPLFEGHPEYFAPDDIHENAQGSKVIAEAVVEMMKAHCIAQPASSGCCRP